MTILWPPFVGWMFFCSLLFRILSRTRVNISLGYNFTSKQLKNVGLNNLKVYVQAMNPFTIYKACDWLDTDLLNYDNNTKTFGSATTLKSFVIGVNIGF